jgi:hypothetical protein
MGNAVDFTLGIRKVPPEYVAISAAKIVGGVKGEVVKRSNDSDIHTNLPKFSNTSDIYFRQNRNGVCQARVYMSHRTCLDFDWSHPHNNIGDARHFKIGVVHVQEYQWHSDGTFIRLSNDARYMNNYEIKKYGALIKAFCPNVKFR